MDFENLQVWVRGMQLTEDIYVLTKKFPKEEVYAITSQMRRAAVSVPSNIAEGSQRTTDKDFAHFVRMAKGSLAELQTQLYLSKRLQYISDEECGKLLKEIITLHRMLHSFHSKLQAPSS